MYGLNFLKNILNNNNTLYCGQVFAFSYTGWPRKNATTLIVNFINIVDETELFFILFGRTFIFQQNDTMIISFG